MFEFPVCRIKVSQLLFLEILFHRSSAFIHGPILKPFNRIIYYDSISDKFAFQRCSSNVKVNVKVAILRKNFVNALTTSFIYLRYSLTHILGMTIPRMSFRVRVKVTYAIFRNTLSLL